jgi:hypothetical protein
MKKPSATKHDLGAGNGLAVRSAAVLQKGITKKEKKNPMSESRSTGSSSNNSYHENRF